MCKSQLKTDFRRVEVCAPAGSWESLAAAMKAGADSVYFGAGRLNMRSHSSANFAKGDIRRIAEKCRKAGVKPYLALNSILYDEELDEAREFCDVAKRHGVSAVIASDLSIMEYAASIGLPVHVSVQANVANFATLKFLSRFADVFVLARELSLPQIAKIAKSIVDEGILSPSGMLPRIEVFVHGALCVAVAGTCSMSLVNYGKSAFRGECYQNCRRRYRVVDDETGQEFAVENNFVMSPKDLCCIRILDRIVSAGVSILKIEGRGRSPDYVFETTKAYAEAVGRIADGSFSAKFAGEMERRLASVFNRGFWRGGYYLGDRSGEWSGISGGRAGKTKTFAGRVSNYFPKAACAEADLQAEVLKVGDEILVTGATTGALKFRIESLRMDDERVEVAPKGSAPTFPSPERLRRGDRIYRLDSGWNADNGKSAHESS